LLNITRLFRGQAKCPLDRRCPDHSAITLALNGIDDSKKGPKFWKSNSTLVDNNDYRHLLDGNFKKWQEEFKEITD